jgi:hypothetical protein
MPISSIPALRNRLETLFSQDPAHALLRRALHELLWVHHGELIISMVQRAKIPLAKNRSDSCNCSDVRLTDMLSFDHPDSLQLICLAISPALNDSSATEMSYDIGHRVYDILHITITHFGINRK